jgi:hypothetical protein
MSAHPEPRRVGEQKAFWGFLLGPTQSDRRGTGYWVTADRAHVKRGSVATENYFLQLRSSSS